MSPVENPTPYIPLLERGKINNNPSEIGFMALLKEDFDTHDRNLFEQGLWAIAVHRFGNWRMGIQPRIVRLPFSLLYSILYKVVEWLCGISLPYTVRLGRRVRLWHHGGMILHAESVGNDAHIRHNTTFGIARIHHNEELPVIGNRVDIGCGACILGRVRVGDDAVIGANAVVVRDVPANSVVGGVPAKLIRMKSASSAPQENHNG
jgi:serine O-acetyltransferase